MPATVAIVMRTKDRPLLLARALASVLTQRFTDWELVVVNDAGSVEGLKKAIAPFQHPFAGRLRVIHRPESLGMEAASNHAIAESDSRYVVIHDDDDSWHPDFLAETVAFLEADAGERYCGVVTWSELVHERIEGEGIVTTGRQPYNNWYYHVDLQRLLGQNLFAPISFLFRRSILESVGLFNESLPVLGDWDFSIRCALARDIAVIPKFLAHYHQRPELRNDDIYGNSVHARHVQHQVVGSELRNRSLRTYLARHPEETGLLSAIMQNFVRIDERTNFAELQYGRMLRRLDELHATLADLGSREDGAKSSNQQETSDLRTLREQRVGRSRTLTAEGEEMAWHPRAVAASGDQPVRDFAVVEGYATLRVLSDRIEELHGLLRLQGDEIGRIAGLARKLDRLLVSPRSLGRLFRHAGQAVTSWRKR